MSQIPKDSKIPKKYKISKIYFIQRNYSEDCSQAKIIDDNI